ncbi:Lysine exporter protein (LYSE/YGGA) [Desulfofarcimen acetoxidans DSM 771]|uniref:Lysine exporter protein (LYSE/YGGA) n=1 Tax=Desulfofarcimen acetoxidans (strain ATCC 49208 / DSM 771 / KCTC 5769 / VKM B-1644 / 5575) TaxID=485916 RepID=C8W422_DESAS|nr:LysE family transporter [Desulfofarcimen acetoxidans]ACV61276.1 Lysine exporter protein (LYSE/YGGA) [Desulfofarcimen acetoxidans DSM 771]
MDNATIFTTALLVGFSGAIMPGPLLTVTIMQTVVKGFKAGLLIVLGHAILEALLVAALVLGLASFLVQSEVKSLIAVVGGVFLIYLGFSMARSSRVSFNAVNPSLKIENIWQQNVAGEYDKQCKLRNEHYEESLPSNNGGPEKERLSHHDSRYNSETSFSGNIKAGGLHGVSMHPVLAGILVSLSNPYWSIWWATLGLSYITLALENGTAGLLSFFSGHILADFIWYALVAAAVAGSRNFIKPAIYRVIVLICAVFLVVLGGYFIHSGIWVHV